MIGAVPSVVKQPRLRYGDRSRKGKQDDIGLDGIIGLWDWKKNRAFIGILGAFDDL